MTGWRIIAALVPLLLALGIPAFSPAHAEASDIAAAARGVVRVVIVGRDGDEIFPVSHGTGFSVGGERIVTNAHVVTEAVQDGTLSIGIVPPEGGEAVYARIVAVSQRNDLALLRTTSALGLPALTIAGNPAASGSVTSIGYPMNVDRAQGLGATDIFRATPPVTSTGFLSGRRPSREFDSLLHTAPIARGNSGGPLVDDCGRVVGVNSFGAESGTAEAEFFFAVSTRELLPFLRANNIAPRINSSPCRSIEEFEAAEYQRTSRQQAEDAARSEEQEEALSRRSEDLRRDITYAVFDARTNLSALALLLLVMAMGAGSLAVVMHLRGENRLRAIAGGAALALLVGAVIAWVLRPGFGEIDRKLEDALRAEMVEAEPLVVAAPAAQEASLTCVLDSERSRVVSVPEDDVPLAWTADGCVNARTQYGLSGGDWTRVFVPADESAVSVSRFNPAAREYVVERYLLDRETMTAARAARAAYDTPQCGRGPDAARELGTAQAAVVASLPQRPNERLVYRCRAASPAG